MSFPTPYTILPDALHFKEFYGGFTGTCGETALTAALICAERLPDDEAQAIQLMLDITHQMQAMNWASANGASTLWSLAREASTKRGGTINLEWDYAEPFPHDWHSVLLANAGVMPIVLQVGLAYNLQGQDSTGGDEAGVHYHFICVVGKCPDGYICMDGDNWKIEQELSIYSYATLQAADICGLLMLDEKAPTPMSITIDKDASGNVTGAHDDQNGNKVGIGFAEAIVKDNLEAGSIAVAETYIRSDESLAIIRGGARALLCYSVANGVSVVNDLNTIDLVQNLVADRAAPAADTALQAQVATLQSQLSAAQAQVAALHAGAVSASQVLSPLGAASQEVADALKKAGF